MTQAEGLWAFKLAEQDWSFRSCDGIDRLFHRMFQSETSEKFAIVRTKMSFVVRHGLGPSVLEEISKDINASVGCITLLLDETATAQVKKQCHFLIQYWSEELNEICTRYVTSKMFGHTSVEHLMQLTLDVLDECSLLLEKFANISTDGPNINKSLHRKLDSKLKESYLHPRLLPFNPCNLHKCHNVFHKGITIYGKDSENLTFELHAWFKISPCKREDFLQVAFKLQSMEYFSKNKALFCRHVETRWLTLFPALEKVLGRWEVSKEYFLEYLPKQKGFEKGAANNERYQRISTLFKIENIILVQIAFLIFAAIPLQKFLTTFQFGGPLIQILFKELKSLLKSIMLRYIDPKILEGNSGADLAKIVVDSQENQLSLDKIVVGAKTERFLKKVSPHDARRERIAMKNFLVVVSSYLQKKLPLQDKLLISAARLHPVT